MATYIQPDADGSLEWVVTMEPREDAVTLDAESVMGLAAELSVVSALCAFLQTKSEAFVGEDAVSSRGSRRPVSSLSQRVRGRRGESVKRCGETRRFGGVGGDRRCRERVVEHRQRRPGGRREIDRDGETVHATILGIDIAAHRAAFDQPIDERRDAGGRDAQVVPQVAGRVPGLSAM